MKLPAFLQSFASTLLHRSQLNDETDEELRSHIQYRADDLERSGLSRTEAERRARIEFGGYQRYKEECSEAVAGHFLETLWQDLRFGLRVLIKSPAFTSVAVLTLALGIGANAVVFSVLNALILRPLDLLQSQSLHMIEQGKTDDSILQSYPDYRDLRDRNRSFDGIIAYSIDRAGLNIDGSASTSWIYEASGNYFDMLGIQPYLGRFFHRSDEHGANSAPYIVLSYAFWHSRFRGDPSVVGRTVQVNKFPYTILGVAPPRFRGTELFYLPDFWVPIVNQEQMEGSSDLNDRGSRGTWLLGRLKAGVTPAQATADLDSIAVSLAKSYPKEDDKISFFLTRPGLVGTMLGRPVRAFLTGLMLLAGLILLAACANLGSLFAARAADRAREIALRLALGSSRKRILRQLLTEAMLVSLAGGAIGLLGAIFLLRWLSVWRPITNFPVLVPVYPDAKVYTVAVLLALLSGFLFGVVPTQLVLRANPWQVVKSGATNFNGRRISLRDLLLVTQIAICALLVTSSFVAVRALAHSLHNNIGFQPQNAIVIDTDLDMAGYSGDQVHIMQRRMLDNLEAIPGVTAVGLVDRAPLDADWNGSFAFTDSTTDLRISNAAADVLLYSITPGYFRAAGTALLEGRSFTWHDDGKVPPVAVVNRTFARQVFGPNVNAIGQHYKTPDGIRIEVVGVVEDGKYKTLTEEPHAAAFRPILQAPSSASFLVIRSKRDPQQLAAAVEQTLHKLDPALPFELKTWNKSLDSALFAARAATVSLGVLGGLGAMLSITGIFGMAAYSVSKRLRELGIRIALGAQRKEVLQAALGRALRLMALGSAAGVLLGIAATHLLSFIVYQATPRDPLVLLGAVLTMTLLGLLATWIPAARALKADPLALLRED